MQWVAEAVIAGARESQACELVGLSLRSVQRWRAGKLEDKRKGATKQTARKLTAQETQQVYDTANQERFADKTPEQIVATLCQEGTYIASPRTFCRILRARNALNRRQDIKTPSPHSKPDQRVATAPNQVWTWDITWLASNVKAHFHYAYVIMDIYDRSIVGWAIHDTEDGLHSRALFERTCLLQRACPKFVHSDNGGPMKAFTLVEFLYSKHILPTTNRPRVSNDNAFSESLFKTLKYRASYPRCFTSILTSMTWFAGFVDWYNTKHQHSSLAYVTPAERRGGLDYAILYRRNRTLQTARQNHPLRWGSRPARNYEIPHEVVLNKASA